MRQSAEVRRVHRGDPGAHRPGRLAVFGISIVFAVLLPGLLGPAGAVPPREVLGSGDPFGSVESISVSGGRVTASGWAVDPDTASSIIVQMYVDGSANTMAWAGVERPDVAAVYPWAGAAHGFSLSLDVAPGAHRVCVYAINTGPGASVALDCRLVAGPPFFVYGSLRNGQSGYYLIDGKTTNEFTTRMPLLDLYVLSGSSYPYAVPNDGNQVGIVGEVMSIHPVLYQDVVSLLDRHERYDPTAPPDNQVYVRELRPTREELPSWVYVAGPRQASYLRSSGILIASGDWLRW